MNTTTRDEVAILVGAVDRGLLTRAEALAKPYLTQGQRAELAAELADEE